MRQYLQYLLWLGIAVRIAEPVGTLRVLGVPRKAIDVIGAVWETRSISPVNSSAIGEGVVWWALVEAVGPAPGFGVRVQYHLAVSSDVGRHIAVAGVAIVLPAASHVHQVKLTAPTSTFYDLQREPHLEVRRFWDLRV